MIEDIKKEISAMLYSGCDPDCSSCRHKKECSGGIDKCRDSALVNWKISKATATDWAEEFEKLFKKYVAQLLVKLTKDLEEDLKYERSEFEKSAWWDN